MVNLERTFIIVKLFLELFNNIIKKRVFTQQHSVTVIEKTSSTLIVVLES